MRSEACEGSGSRSWCSYGTEELAGSENAKASIDLCRWHGIQAFAFSFSFCQGSSNGANVENAVFYLKGHREFTVRVFRALHTHLGPLQVEGLSVVAQQHDVFLQVAQAPVLMITNPFLMGIWDKIEEKRKERKIQQLLLASQNPIFPLSSQHLALPGVRDSTIQGCGPERPPSHARAFLRGGRRSRGWETERAMGLQSLKRQ